MTYHTSNSAVKAGTEIIKMRNVALFCIAVCATALLAGNPSQIVPGLLADPRYEAAWVAADLAIGSDGHVRADLLKRHARSVVGYAAEEHRQRRIVEALPRARDTKAMAPVVCAAMINALAEYHDPIRSPEDLLSAATTIFSGRIVGIREGFYHGVPGSLMRLNGSALRGETAKETYLFYPFATIKTAQGMVCARPAGKYAKPEIGDDVAIFDPTPTPFSMDGRTVFSVTINQHVVYRTKAGNTILPEAFRSFDNADDPMRAVLDFVEAAR
jgi:hypothetical protein